MVSAGSQCFEFDGEITEIGPEYIILNAKHGEIYIERKYLVFIQYLKEEKEEPEEELVSPNTKPKPDAAARFVQARRIQQELKRDPLDDVLEEKFVPPSQLPDNAFEDDDEVMKNVMSAVQGPDRPPLRHPKLVAKDNLQQAVKAAMQNEDFSMGAGGVQYKSPAQTILGMKNANNKKS